jgi:hypothetical protein
MQQYKYTIDKTVLWTIRSWYVDNKDLYEMSYCQGEDCDGFWDVAPCSLVDYWRSEMLIASIVRDFFLKTPTTDVWRAVLQCPV